MGASRTGVDRRIRSEPRAPPSHVEGLLHPSRSTASACAKPGAVLLDEERRMRRRSLGNLDALVAAATRDPRCHAASHPAGPLGDNQDDSKGRKSMGNIIARATGIAFVGGLFRSKNNPATPNAEYPPVPSIFLEEDGDYHHEYFHSGVANKLVNMGCTDDDC